MKFHFIGHFALIYSELHTYNNVWMVCVVVSTLAFRAGDRGSIPPMDQQIFNFPFSPSHPSGVTKPSSLKLVTSGITYPSDSQRGES